MNTKYIWLLVILFGFTACNDVDDVLAENNAEIPKEVVLPDLTAGSADFSTFVALGNSLTAGFTDGALFKTAQENSLSNILAQKFAMAGGGAFTQPLTDDNIGGLLLGGNQIASPRLFFNGSGPTVLDATPTTEISAIAGGPFNNLGVPGAKSFHLLAPGYGNIQGLPNTANPYFVRMASSPNTSVIADAMAQSPTFFSLWIGNNDVLGYALSGGDGSNPITPQQTFDFAYSTLITTLTSGGAGGVVANIPDVTSIPHFTTVPYNPLDPTNPDFGPQIPTLNATFAALNNAFDFLQVPNRKVVFATDAASAVLIHDETLDNIAVQLSVVLQGGGLDPITASIYANQFGQSRQATADDLLVLPSSNVIATVNVEYYTQLVTAGVPAANAGQLAVNGVTYPLKDKWVLLPKEQEEIKIATDQFNATIFNAADAAGLAKVDTNGLMNQLAATGLVYGDYNVTAKLVTGGVFSLDGVHPTARGNALIANKFMEAIDVTYGTNFIEAGASTKAGDYPTNYNPALQ